MELFMNTVATLFAAFLGAIAAFWLENLRRKREEKKNQIGAGNRAILVLWYFWNELVVIRRQVIEPVRDHPARLIAMQAMPQRLQNKLSIDISELYFLIEKQHVTLLMKLLIEESLFLGVVSSFNIRSVLHIQEAQPAMVRAGLSESVPFTINQVQAALGERLFLTLQRATDQVIEHTDQTIESIKNTSDELHRTLKEVFPKAKVVYFGSKDLT